MVHQQGSSSFLTVGVLWWATFLLAGCGLPSRDTNAISESVISGSIKDNRDAPVHGAVVGARNLGMGVTTFVVTNPEGEFQTPPLRNGSYQISVERQGYRLDTLELDLDGSPQDVHVRLEPLSIVPVSQITNVDFNRYLPEDSGKRAVIRICGQCHSLRNPFLEEGRTRDEWATLAERMMAGVVWSGPDNFTELDTQPIVDYLAKYHGPESSLPEELGERIT